MKNQETIDTEEILRRIDEIRKELRYHATDKYIFDAFCTLREYIYKLIDEIERTKK